MNFFRLRLGVSVALALAGACSTKATTVTDAGMDAATTDSGVDAGPVACADPGVPFDVGDSQGHLDPLNATAGQARAGRITAAQLPRTPSGLGKWEGGDFVLANSRVAMVIEDTGDSDLYDPWGGKPIGLAHVSGGQLVDPSDFGEMLVFVFGPSTVVTEHVGVINDGSDGHAAVVRAEGRIEAIPFVVGLIGVYWQGNTFRDVATRFAIDYVLEPDSEHVDIMLHARHARADDVLFSDGPEAHGYMYSDRLQAFQQDGAGFNTGVFADREWMAFIDSRGVGYAFEVPGVLMQPLPSESGFMGSRNEGHVYLPCTEVDGDVHHYGRVHIGGPDADPLLEVLARSHGESTRAVTGHVTDGNGGDGIDVHVHVVDAANHANYVTRTRTDANGDFTFHVPTGTDVDVYGFVQGRAVVGPDRVMSTDADSALALPATATLHVDGAVDGMAGAIPYKLQILPTGATTNPLPLYANWGEELPTSGRLFERHVLPNQSIDIVLPVGTWKLVASRGFRYEIHEQLVTATAGGTLSFSPVLTRSIDTPNTLCADFHIHTRRSNDVGDDVTMKLSSALAEDLDIPVRSDHEYAEEWDSIITTPVAQGGFNSAPYAIGVTSVELTTMELYGHFGVIPVIPDLTLPNNGAPRWQDFASESDYSRSLHTLTPTELFARVHARSENPFLIVNHPHGGNNYFGYTGYDGVTGTVGRPERWSENFDGIEVFNSATWVSARNTTVRDWFSFLDRGVHMVAVASSDSHSITSSPVGNVRTCLDFGPTGITGIPQAPAARANFGFDVRDVLAAGHAVVTGGVFVDASVAGTGPSVSRPGDTAVGLGTTANVHITVRAASWVDVDTIEVVVDGQTYDTLDVATECTQNGVIRCDIPSYNVPVAAVNGYVVVAAYGNDTMEPVLRGRVPFGATNAVYLER